MTDPSNHLTSTDLEAQAGASLPDKEAMSLLSDSLLNLNVNVDLTANAAAPVGAAVAANANAAAPIDGAVSANIASNGGISEAAAVQHSTIDQTLSGVADATTNQAAAASQQ
jgi:hypothetical protein